MPKNRAMENHVKRGIAVCIGCGQKLYRFF